GAPQARPHQGLAQAAHRQRLRHLGVGGQQAAEAASRDAAHDEADDQAREEGPDAPWPLRPDAAALMMCTLALATYSMSPPRKRGSRASDELVALDPRF